jgi:ATP-dependent protease ClpP protease subunit
MRIRLWIIAILALAVLQSSAMAQSGPEPKTITIRFFGPVTDATVGKLLTTIESKLSQGYRRIVLLISSQGGSVFSGLTAYNYLRGIPAEIITHNFGAVDSIAAVIYCAGTKRYTVPQGRFVLHGVVAVFPTPMTVDEPGLQEKLKLVKQDESAIAAVIADTLKKPLGEIRQAMLDRTVLNVEDAKKWGLVHEVRFKLFEEGAEVISISDAKTETDVQHVSTVSDPAPFSLLTTASMLFTVPDDTSSLPPSPQ